MSGIVNMFFYAFEVLTENENAFVEYMEKFGSPIMSKYCMNWRLFKLNRPLRGNEIPQYIGFFEIPDMDVFFSSEPPEEMKETLNQAAKVCTKIREWVGNQIASNI